MDIAITGSSGLVGTALKADLTAKGHRPIGVVRRQPKPGSDEIQWDPAAGTIDAESLNGVGAVVHLAGAGIADKRWTDARKQLILDSRVDSTTLLATTLAGLAKPPGAFVSGSAVGFYGSRGDEELTESSTRGEGYLADVTVAWEEAAQPAIDAGIRTTFARTGIVLSTAGGALAKQLPLFKFGLGGKLGNGRQWLPWISIDDEINALQFLIESELSGPVNLTAPAPCTNAEFTTALGKALGRPTILPIPSFGPKLLLGADLADALLFGSQKILPNVLTTAGYSFVHADIATALNDICGRTRETT